MSENHNRHHATWEHHPLVEHTPQHRADDPYDQDVDLLDEPSLAGPRVLFLALMITCVPLAVAAGAIGWAGHSVTAYIVGALLGAVAAFGTFILWLRGEK